MSLQNPALKDFWEQQSRYKVLYGGRASSKSWDAGIQAIKLSRVIKLKILCTRQFQSNIRESVYTLLKDTIYRMKVESEFTILHNTIKHNTTGSEFIFMGIARNIEEIKSTEGIDIMWVEEASLLTKDQWDIILPTIRKQGSEIWLIFNPAHRSDFIWQRFIEHPHENSLVKKINYTENPYLSTTMRDVILEAKEEDNDEYEHIYLGIPREGDEKALFTYDEVERAMDNSLEALKYVDKTGVFSYGIDVARYGNDKSVISKRKGFLIYGLEEFKNYNTMEYANKVTDIYNNEQDKKPMALFVDTIGVGAGVMDRLEERGYRAIDSNASMKADDIDVYGNKRAEMYFLLRDFIRKGGKIPNDDDLKEELLAIRYIFSKTNGKILIQPKDEIKEIIGRSPDKSDSVALHFFSEVRIDQISVAELQRQKFKQKSFKRRMRR